MKTNCYNIKSLSVGISFSLSLSHLTYSLLFTITHCSYRRVELYHSYEYRCLREFLKGRRLKGHGAIAANLMMTLRYLSLLHCGPAFRFDCRRRQTHWGILLFVCLVARARDVWGRMAEASSVSSKSTNSDENASSVIVDDDILLESMGYKKELYRGLDAFANFAFGFTEVAVLPSFISLYTFGLETGGKLYSHIWIALGCAVNAFLSSKFL